MNTKDDDLEQAEHNTVNPVIRIRSCLGCMAMEWSLFPYGQDYCSLGYKTKRIPTVAGCYGKSHQIIACNCAPIEPCPKPKTCKKTLELQLAKLYSRAKITKIQ